MMGLTYVVIAEVLVDDLDANKHFAGFPRHVDYMLTTLSWQLSLRSCL